MPTRLPGSGSVTPVPTASTTPTTWCPGVSGNFGSSRSPSTVCRSVRQAPQANTRSRS